MLVNTQLECGGKLREKRDPQTLARGVGACVLPFLSHCLQGRGSREEACGVLSHLSKDGLRPPKVNKETRPLDFSEYGLQLQTPQPKALEDQSSGRYSCPGLWASPWDVPGPGATPCLTVIPGRTPPDAPHQPLAGH